MSLFRNLFKKEKDNEEIVEIHSDEFFIDDDSEIISAITAAICCVLQMSPNEFTVSSIARTFEVDSLWAVAGRMKLMR